VLKKKNLRDLRKKRGGKKKVSPRVVLKKILDSEEKLDAGF